MENMENATSPSQPSLEDDKPVRLHGSACDTCRRRRVRCDGNQPCERCRKSRVSCTYGSVSNRMSSVSYARHLETKVAELRSLLHQRPTTESNTSTQEMESYQDSVRQDALDMLIGPGDDFVYRATGENANIFYGRFGGLSVMRTLGTNAVQLAHSPSREWFSRGLTQTFDIVSLYPVSLPHARAFAMLPPKSQVQHWSEQATKTALTCHECLDRQDFVKCLQKIYAVDPEDYTPADKGFLALVYAMIALGKRFSPVGNEDEINEHGMRVKFKGLAYFHASRETLNITEANDLNAIRAVICQARYLSSMSMVSKAYSQICIGVAIAMRLGLHTTSSAVGAKFSADELFERRKVFATLNMMEVYLSSLLGLPLILKDADPAQKLGLREEDRLDEGRLYVLRNMNSALAQTILCQRANQILAKICDTRYRLSSRGSDAFAEHYEEDVNEVADREVEIDDWCSSLPPLPTETTDLADLANVQAHLTLRAWHALVQLVLYRPFLHHLAKCRDDRNFSMLGFEHGSKCVRAATQAILTLEVFQTYGVLHEGYWMYIYMLESAVSILLYFISVSSQSATIEESFSATMKAREMLKDLAKYNLSARNCYDSLEVVLGASQDLRNCLSTPVHTVRNGT